VGVDHRYFLTLSHPSRFSTAGRDRHHSGRHAETSLRLDVGDYHLGDRPTLV
jgi:hypothetical protein